MSGVRIVNARVLASGALACLFALFAFDQGGDVLMASIVSGAVMIARFLLYPLVTGRQPSGASRRIMNAVLLGLLWVASLMLLATDWMPANTFLPLLVLGGLWMMLDRPASRYLDTGLVGGTSLAAIVVFSVIEQPDVVTLPSAAFVGLSLIIAFGHLDRARVIETLGRVQPGRRIRLDPWAVVVLLLISVPIATVLPVPGADKERAREAWSQSLERIAGFSDRIDLTRLGELKSNDNGALVVSVWDVEEDANQIGGWRDVAMWRNDDEASPNRHPLLLRGATLGRWNGKEFSRFPSGDHDPRFGERVDTDTFRWEYVRQEIEMAAHGHDMLFGMERVRHEAIPPGGRSVVISRHGELTASAPVMEKLTYGVISRILPPSQRDALRYKAAVHVDERYRSRQGISRDVRAEARRVMAGAARKSDYDRVVHLERWFRFRSMGGFSYTRFNQNDPEHPIESFLIETKAGHCEFFATAMVLMLRAEGIPARVAVGFRGGTWSDMAEAFRVLQKDAHAWVEVPFEGAGWIPFDPTPPESVLDLATPGNPGQDSGGPGPLAEGGIEGEDAVAEQIRSEAPPPGAIWAAIGGAVLVAVGAWLLRRRLRASEADGPRFKGLAGGLQARLLRLLQKVGVKRRRSATLKELLDDAAALPDGALPALAGVVALLYRDRYGGRPLDHAETSRIGEILDDVERRLDG